MYFLDTTLTTIGANYQQQTSRSMVELTQAIVRELLDYNPDTGVLTWRRRGRRWFTSAHAWNAWNAKHAGKIAFTALTAAGYPNGAIFNKGYKAHRIIWLWMTGSWPHPEIDHDNHDRSDNRWCNLYRATHQDNTRNRSLRCDNAIGHVGVFKTRRGTFCAHIGVDGRRRHLGNHPTFEAAVAARKAAERRYGFHPRHGAIARPHCRPRLEAA
jgi:hypothetical protein